mmetsp:Transcript_11302/g.32071  ORF Transcript_11302/g.32071 Transcript_11302/m.32071 type:complete len:253 (-) Transcript_11302:336-1094(-)
MLAKVLFRSFLQPGENHGADLFRSQQVGLALELHRQQRLVVGIRGDLERPQGAVLLYRGVTEVAPDQPLGVKDCVLWIGCHLVVGLLSNEPLLVCEGNVAWHNPAAIAIRNDFHLAVPPHRDAAEGGAEVDANRTCGASELLSVQPSGHLANSGISRGGSSGAVKVRPCLLLIDRRHHHFLPMLLLLLFWPPLGLLGLHRQLLRCFRQRHLRGHVDVGAEAVRLFRNAVRSFWKGGRGGRSDLRLARHRLLF